MPTSTYPFSSLDVCETEIGQPMLKMGLPMSWEPVYLNDFVAPASSVALGGF